MGQKATSYPRHAFTNVVLKSKKPESRHRKKSDNAAMDASAATSVAPASGQGNADSPPAPSSSSKKPHLKEKITQMYECLTRGDDTDRHPTFGNNFWAEFFLLRPKISVLEAEIGKVSGFSYMSKVITTQKTRHFLDISPIIQCMVISGKICGICQNINLSNIQ